MSHKKVKCKINGHEVEVSQGTTIIEAFKILEKEIAHYCWHPGLKIAGVCRLCMVEIEGNPKLQIACNTQVQEGMVISNQSDKVKETVRWGLEFHLINHPLDCPICDQAGECELQNQYMKFGRYKPGMSDSKVKKRKVVDLGSKIVLDTERCILCSRCVRFTEEVTKTNELGIFNRGDRSEIGVFKDKPLDNNYAMNTVDICPVGALTSKDFRFKQRVWYLKHNKSVCTGCSTGCNIKAFYNEEGMWRVQPHYNPEVNGHWMCDKGRGLYKGTRKENRLTQAQEGLGTGWKFVNSIKALEKIKTKTDLSSCAVLLTGQYTTEEYQAVKNTFKKATFYHWQNYEDKVNEFDGLLLRGDYNPNTKGLKSVFPKIKSWNKFQSNLSKIKTVFVAGPENQNFYPCLEEKTKEIQKISQVIWMSMNPNPYLSANKNFCQIPLKSVFEKEGTFTNYKGIDQKITKTQTLVSQALCLKEVSQVLEGLVVKSDETEYPYFKQNQFLSKPEKLGR